MKKLLILASLFSGVALADQCAYITHSEAARAVLLLQKGAVVGFNCAPCGEVGIQKLEVVNSAVVASANFQDFSQVRVNGQGIDLAYTYIQTSPNKLVNLAKAIGCEALDVKSVPSTLKIK